MTSEATTPEAYIAQLPEERKAPITKLNNLIIKHMPKGLEAGMGYGMLAYYVPKSIYNLNIQKPLNQTKKSKKNKKDKK